MQDKSPPYMRAEPILPTPGGLLTPYTHLPAWPYIQSFAPLLQAGLRSMYSYLLSLALSSSLCSRCTSISATHKSVAGPFIVGVRPHGNVHDRAHCQTCKCD